MRKVLLADTGIEVSYVGLGTSAAYDGVVYPAKMRVDDYPELLCFGYDIGVNFWDTSLTYGTHPAIRKALGSISREKVVICSKTTEVNPDKVKKDLERTLKDLGSDYIDIFLMQCVRNKFDFKRRLKAFDVLRKCKDKGYIRAIGIASHGIGALEACIDSRYIDIIMGRVNYSGHLMDSRQDDLKSVLAGMPLVKKLSKDILPKAIFKKLASNVQKQIVSKEDHEATIDIFGKIHSHGKSIIGMKVLGEGHLVGDVPKAIGYVKALSSIDSVVVGCCSKDELMQVIKESNLS